MEDAIDYFKTKLEQIDDGELKKEIEDFVLICTEWPMTALAHEIETRITYLVFKAYLAGQGAILDKFSPEVDKISEKINDIKKML